MQQDSVGTNNKDGKTDNKSIRQGIKEELKKLEEAGLLIGDAEKLTKRKKLDHLKQIFKNYFKKATEISKKEGKPMPSSAIRLLEKIRVGEYRTNICGHFDGGDYIKVPKSLIKEEDKDKDKDKDKEEGRLRLKPLEALFLSELYSKWTYWEKERKLVDGGFFFWTRDKIKEEIGLTRPQLETVRKVLKHKGLIDFKRTEKFGKTYYKVL